MIKIHVGNIYTMRYCISHPFMASLSGGQKGKLTMIGMAKRRKQLVPENLSSGSAVEGSYLRKTCLWPVTARCCTAELQRYSDFPSFIVCLLKLHPCRNQSTLTLTCPSVPLQSIFFPSSFPSIFPQPQATRDMLFILAFPRPLSFLSFSP